MKRSDIPTIEVLKACNALQPRSITPYQYLINKFKAPEKVVFAAMDRDYSKGLIEYGVCLSSSWLTNKGHIYLSHSQSL